MNIDLKNWIQVMPRVDQESCCGAAVFNMDSSDFVYGTIFVLYVVLFVMLGCYHR